MMDFIYEIRSRPLYVILPLGAAALCLLYTVSTIIYQLYLSPLSKYPGPKLASISRIPSLWHNLNGDIVPWVHSLHQKCGDVVRIAPDELSYATGSGWKDIYGHAVHGQKTTLKDARFYGPSIIEGTTDIIRAGEAEHSRFRRNFSHAFSERALKDQESLIRIYVDLLITKLREAVADKPDAKIELVKMYNFTTFDIMGDLTFGEPLGLLEGSEYDPWVTSIFGTVKFGVMSRLTRYYSSLAALTNILVPKSVLRKRLSHIQYCIERVDRRLAKKEARLDIWGLIMNQEKEEQKMTLSELYSNSNIFMVAGTETTATELSGLTYQLLMNPEKMDKLVTEIRSAFASDQEITIAGLVKLGYLQACLEEGLRMYPPVPGGLPRVAPPEGKMVCGEMIPGKTALSVNHWATYRNPKNFKYPDSFIPERWSNKDPKSEFASDKKAALQPFSFGPRNCLGKNLAYHEMRLILSKVLYHFDLTLCEESANWTDQKVYSIWEKNPLFVKLTPRKMEN